MTIYNDSLFYLFASIVCVLAHASLGRRLGIHGVITSSLTGAGASSIIIAILANSCAVAIKPYCLLSCGLFGALSLFDLIRSVRASRSQVLAPLALLAGAFMLSVYINPVEDILKPDAKGDIILTLNHHDTYFSSQSAEMLCAEYAARLRIRNIYPETWSRYHFHAGSTLALAQSAVNTPNLISYYSAKSAYVALILVALVETLLLLYGTNLVKLARILFGFLFGILVFRDVIGWNFATTGSFSVFAMFLFVVFLFANRPSCAFVAGILLSVSAFRLAPFGLAVSAVLIWLRLGKSLDYRKARVLLASNMHLALLVVLAGLYMLVTMLYPPSMEESCQFMPDIKFHDGWMRSFSAYKFAGYLLHTLGHPEAYPQYNATGFWENLLGFRSVRVTFFLLLTCLFVFLFAEPLATRATRTTRPCSCYSKVFWIVTAMVAYSLTDKDLFRLHLLFLPCLLVTAVVGKRIITAAASTNPEGATNPLAIMCGLQIAALCFNYLGNGGIQAPVLWTVVDIGLWALFALFFVVENKSRVHKLSLLSLLGIALCFLPGKLDLVTVISRDPFNNFHINVTRLYSASATRDSFVSDGLLTPLDGNIIVEDAHATLLGCRLRSDARSASLMSHRFTTK